VVRLDSLRYTVKNLLDRAQTQGHLEHRGAKGVHHPAAVAIAPSHFTHQRTEAGSIAGGVLSRNLDFTPTPAGLTPALMQDLVGHVDRHGWQSQHLMRVVRHSQGKRRVATRTPLRPQRMDGRGQQEHLAMARMAWFAPCFAAWGRGRTLTWLLVGRVR